MTKSDPHCRVEGCESPIKARGLCSAHDNRLRRYGDFERRRPIVGWSRKFERCVECGTDETPHVGKGLCRECAERKYAAGQQTKTRRRSLKKYGLTQEDYDALWASQNGCCKICQRQPEAKLIMKGNKLSHSLHIDHDHTTNVIRGLLCDSCNRGMGFFFDDPDLLIAAAAYLRMHKAVESEAKVLN